MRVINHFMLWCLGLAEPEALTTEAERKWLARYAAGRKRLAEIGVWHGVTTCLLRSVMAPDGLLFAVDLYPVGRLGFSAQMVIARSEVAKIPNGSSGGCASPELRPGANTPSLLLSQWISPS